MSDSKLSEFEITLTRKDAYKFEVDFGNEFFPKLLVDEPESVPGGENLGPNASMLLAAAVGNCLSASLTFCLSKKKIELSELVTKVRIMRERNKEGFWRITGLFVILHTEVEDKEVEQYKKCLEIFQNYCIVSKSVESGIPIKIKVI